MNSRCVCFCLKQTVWMCWRTDSYEFLLPRVRCRVHPLSLVSSTGGASALSARPAGRFVAGSSHGRRAEQRWCGWSRGKNVPSWNTCSHVVCSPLFSDGSCSSWRYLLCELNVSDRSSLLLLDDRAVSAAVKAAVARTHGDYGAALCSIRFNGEQWRKYLDTLLRLQIQALHSDKK